MCAGLLGKVQGPDQGKKLAELPKDEWGIVPWGEWKRKHPDTLVLVCPHCEGTGKPPEGMLAEPGKK